MDAAKLSKGAFFVCEVCQEAFSFSRLNRFKIEEGRMSRGLLWSWRLHSSTAAIRSISASSSDVVS